MEFVRPAGLVLGVQIVKGFGYLDGIDQQFGLLLESRQGFGYP